MSTRLALLTAWLIAGGAAVGGLFWVFLNTSEADVLRLALSAVLGLAIVVVAGIVVNTALLFAAGDPFRVSLRNAWRSLHAFAVAALVVGAAAWATLSADEWVARHAGEVSAWFIARFDWSDVTVLFTAERYLSTWFRWVVVPAAALTGLATFVRRRRWRAAARSMFAAWRWRPLLVITAAFVVLMALPWRLAAGADPGQLPPTWVQPAVAVLRLTLLGASLAVGSAIMMVTTARAGTK